MNYPEEPVLCAETAVVDQPANRGRKGQAPVLQGVGESEGGALGLGHHDVGDDAPDGGLEHGVADALHYEGDHLDVTGRHGFGNNHVEHVHNDEHEGCGDDYAK